MLYQHVNRYVGLCITPPMWATSASSSATDTEDIHDVHNIMVYPPSI